MKYKIYNINEKMIKKASSPIGSLPVSLENFLKKIITTKFSKKDLAAADNELLQLSKSSSSIKGIIDSYSAVSLPGGLAKPDLNHAAIFKNSKDVQDLINNFNKLSSPEKVAIDYFDKKIIEFKNKHRKAFSGESITDNFFNDLESIINEFKAVKEDTTSPPADYLKRTANSGTRMLKKAADIQFKFPGLDDLKNKEINIKINKVLGNDLFTAMMKGDYSKYHNFDDMLRDIVNVNAAIGALPTTAPLSDEKNQEIQSTTFNAQEVSASLGEDLEKKINLCLNNFADLTKFRDLKTLLEGIKNNVKSTLTANRVLNLKKLSKYKTTDRLKINAGLWDTISKEIKQKFQPKQVNVNFKEDKVKIINALLNELKSKIETINIQMIDKMIQEIDKYITAEDITSDPNDFLPIANAYGKEFLNLMSNFFDVTKGIQANVERFINDWNSNVTGSITTPNDGIQELNNSFNNCSKDLELLVREAGEVKQKATEFIDNNKGLFGNKLDDPDAKELFNNLKGMIKLMNNNINFSPQVVPYLKEKFSATIAEDNPQSIVNETRAALKKITPQLDAWMSATSS